LLGRAALGNIIPTTTGAAKAISQVLPELAGKLTGISIRVPTYVPRNRTLILVFTDRTRSTNVSMVDLTVNTSKPTSLAEIISAYRLAAKTSLAGVLGVTDAELVSSDFLGHPFSAVIDVHACVELNSQFFKIIAWYDNEWAYPSRLLDLLAMMAKKDFETKANLCITK
jgi:glyceraldehyde 3-phosphate dehydrogenase